MTNVKYPPELFRFYIRHSFHSSFGTLFTRHSSLVTRHSLFLILLLQSLVPACAKKPPVVLKPSPPPIRPPAPVPPPAPPPKPAETQAKPSGEKQELLPVPSPDTDRAGPSIRIGLSTVPREVRISAAGDFYLMEKTPEAG